MPKFEIIYQNPKSLKPRDRSLRKRNPRQLEHIMRALNRYELCEPILVDRDNKVHHGALRLIAALELGWDEVPTIRIEHLSPEDLRAYYVAATQVAQLAGWDEDLLKIELRELAELNVDLDALGFEPAEMDRLLELTNTMPGLHDEEIPAVNAALVVTQPGYLWGIGDHRLYCGDALLDESYILATGGEKAGLIVIDPPYNDSVRSISGNGRIKHPEFYEASGELSEDEFTRYLTRVMRLLVAHSRDGSLHFVFMSWRHLLALLRAGAIAYDELKNVITWVKQSGGMGGLYRSRSEFVCLFKNGCAPHVNNIQLGRFGRSRENVWEYSGLGSFQKDRDELLAMHPTVKNLEMIKDAILDTSRIGDLVLDSFVGSGTTIIAAHRVERRCAAIEISPLYCDVALRRVRKALGIEPVLLATGETFSELEARQAASGSAA